MIIIDYNGIAISSIVTQKLEIDENLIRHIILNSIRLYRKKFKDQFGEIVITGDAANNWRYKEFSQYKAGRKKSRKDSKMDWDEIFRIINMVWDELGEHFPYKTLKINGCEADDVIATLVDNTQEFGQYEKVMIISADKDFAQLQKYPNVEQYSPMTKKYIKIEHPRKQLLEHILRGDAADGVPNVLSDDNVFVDGRRQERLTSKKMEAIIKDLNDGELLYAASWYRNYQRNERMIDLTQTPKALKSEIINSFNEQDKWNNKGKVLPYLIANRCRRLIDDIGDFIQ